MSDRVGRLETPRVRFVTFEASRTGSARLLLSLLDWLARHRDLRLDVVCWRGGPLVDDLARIADDVVVLGPLDRRGARGVLTASLEVVGRSGLAREADRWLVSRRLRGLAPCDVLYLNGVPSFVALDVVSAPAVIGHVHELDFALDRSLPAGREALLHAPDRYVAVSSAVREGLVRHGVPGESIVVVPGFVGPDDAEGPVDATNREAAGIPVDAMVVGAVGDLIWRKGPDLFVQLARRVRPLASTPVHFVWVGGARGVPDELRWDVGALGVSDRVHFVGERDDVAPWYRLFDVLVLTAREDPFPLVVLEAAAAGVPTVTFRQGGAPEFVEEHGRAAGVVVEPFDLEAMARAVVDLLADPTRRRALGRVARDRQRRSYVAGVVGPRVAAEIDALVPRGGLR